MMKPGLRILTLWSSTFITVDSIQMLHGHPLIIRDTRDPKSCATMSAEVGLGLPERLALGAASGNGMLFKSSWATG